MKQFFSITVANFAVVLLLLCNISSASADTALFWKPVFGEIQVNGRSMLIEGATSQLTAAEQVNRISLDWKKLGQHTIQEKKNGWEIISRLEQGQLEIIQARSDARGSQLLRHRSPLVSHAIAPSPPEWLASEGKALFVTRSADGLNQGQSWLFETSAQGSPKAELERLSRRLQALGFQTHPVFRLSAAKPELGQPQLDPQQAAQTVMSASGGRHVLLQIIAGREKPMLLVTIINGELPNAQSKN